MKKCTMCGQAIPEPRLLAIPFTLTCSAVCARQRKHQAAKRARERRKAARAAKRAVSQ